MPDSTVPLCGEFAVDSNGSATYTIPLQLPPGTHGLQPGLALAYNSAGGVGLAGLGWNLRGLGAITRVPRNFAQDGFCAPIRFAGGDACALDGNRLVLVSSPATDWSEIAHGRKLSDFPPEAYRTEIESGQLAVPAYDASNHVTSWTVFTKDGLRKEFGGTADSRASVTMPTGASATRLWALSRVTDRHGNYYTVQYAASTGEDPRPLTILYTANDTAATKLAAARRVDFTYLPIGYDVPRFAGGANIAPTQLLSGIATSVAGVAALEWSFAYTAGVPGGRPLLASIACPTGPIALRYSPSTLPMAAPSQGIVWQAAGASNFFHAESGSDVVPVDIEGDGHTDFLIIGADAAEGKWLVIAAMQNQGDGTFKLLTLFQPGALWAQYRGATTLDIDGDGVVELIVMLSLPGDQSMWLLKFVQSAGNWTLTNQGFPVCPRPMPAGYVDATAAPDFNQGTFLPFELDGDGYLDLAVVADQGRQLRLFRSNHTNLDAADLGNSSPWNGRPEDGMLFPIDIDGDGRTDLVRVMRDVATNRLKIEAFACLFDASAAPGTQISFAAQPDFALTTALDYTIGMMIPGDINGDGLVDLVWIQNDGASLNVTPFYNTGAGFLAAPAPIVIPAFSRDDVAPLFVGAVADLNQGASGGWLVSNNAPANIADVLAGISHSDFDAGKINFLSVDYQLVDTDGDGRAELVAFAQTNPGVQWNNSSGGSSNLCNSDGSGYVPSPFAAFSVARLNDFTAKVLNHGCLPGPAFGSVFLPADFGGTGANGFMIVSPDSNTAFLPPPAGGADLAIQIGNELGGTLNLAYRPLTDPAVYSRATCARGAGTLERIAGAQFLAGSASTPTALHAPAAALPHVVGSIGSVRLIEFPKYVVSAYAKDRPVGSGNEIHCCYSGARLDVTGRGWLGFDTMRLADTAAGTVRETCFSQIAPFIGQTLATSLQTGPALPASAGNVMVLQGTIMAYADGRAIPAGHQVQLTGSVELWSDGGFVCEEKSVTCTYDACGLSLAATTETTSQFDQPGAPEQVISTLTKRFAFAYRPLSPADGTASGGTSTTPDWARWFVPECARATQEDASGVVLRSRDYTYNAQGEIATVREGDSDPLTITHAYDDYGNRNYSKDSLGAFTVTLYDPDHQTFAREVSRPVPATDGQVISESFTWDARFGVVLSQTDVNGFAAKYTYDALGRLTGHFGNQPDQPPVNPPPDPSVALTQWNYLPNPASGGFTVLATTAIDWNGHTITRERDYDAWGRITGERAPAPDGGIAATSFTYDSRDQIVSQTLPDVTHTPATCQRAFDSWGRLVSEALVLPDQSVARRSSYRWVTSYSCSALTDGGPAVLLRYATCGSKRLLVERTVGDPPSTETTRWTCDALGRVTAVTDPAGIVTATSYDKVDRVTSVTVTDASGRVVQQNSTSYDDTQRKSTHADALGNSEDRTYDACGRLLSQYVYKPGGRTNGTVDIVTTRTWDNRAAQGCDRLCSAAIAVQGGALIQHDYTYDACGRQAGITVTHHDVSAAFAFKRTFTPLGALATLQFPSGVSQTNRYNPAGALDTIGLTLKDGTNLPIASYKWNGLTGRTLTFGNGLNQTQTIDAQGRLASWQLGTPGGAIESCAIIRNPLSDPTVVGDASYGYDPFQRLAAVTNPVATTRYGYTLGDRTGIGPNTATYAGHQLTTLTEKFPSQFSYDAAGNLTRAAWTNADGTAGPVQNFAYDGLNRLTSADGLTAGVTFTAAYDHAGRRVRKCIGNSADANQGYTQRSLAPYYEVTAFAGNAQQTVLYVMGPDGPLAQWADQDAFGQFNGRKVPAGLTFLHRDHLGSITRVSGPDGRIQATLGYTPFGEITANAAALAYTPPGALVANPATAPVRRGFTGQEYDDETGLYYFQARYYHPRLGCFIQADDRPGGPSDLGESYNRYAYALNRPFTFTDPTGHDIFDIFNAIGNFLHIGSIGNWAHSAWKPVAMFSASAGLIVLGAFVTGITGGLATTVGASLMGAGVSGLIYASTSLANHDDLNWGDWGIQLGIGAATGLVAGAGSTMSAAALEGVVDVGMRVALQGSLGLLVGAWGGMTGTLLQNTAAHVDLATGLVLGIAAGAAIGYATGAAGESFANMAPDAIEAPSTTRWGVFKATVKSALKSATQPVETKEIGKSLLKAGLVTADKLTHHGTQW